MATYNALTPSKTDIEVAIISCALDGDTVIVPAGDVSWGNGANLTITKGITLQGAGIGSTKLGFAITTGSRTIMTWDTAAGRSYKMQGIEFYQNGGTSAFNDFITLGGASNSMVVGNCKFVDIPEENLVVRGGCYGVIHSCEFVLSGNVRAAMFHNGYAGGGSYGDGSWETPVSWGGADFMFFEDNTVTRTTMYSAHDGWFGSRAVMRNNLYTNARVANHGTESSQRNRGARAYEVYNNTFNSSIDPGNAYIDIRSGSLVAFGNTITGYNRRAVYFSDYRMHTSFQPWGVADGTKAWDAATGGVFDSGTVTTGASGSLTDSGKGWTTNQWAGYTCRMTAGFTATSGAVRSATVSGAGWTTNQWAGWEITKTSGGTKGRVASNTADTLTLATDFFPVDMTGGGAFVLSRATVITANTATALSLASNFQGTLFVTTTGEAYEIRKVSWLLDGCGRGQTNPFTGATPVGHQNVSQQQEPAYVWSNTVNGAASNAESNGTSVVLDRDYFNSARPGYTPYTYPHPLRGALAAPTFLTQPANQTVIAGNTAVLSAVASGNPAPTYQWRKGGSNISGATSASLIIVNAQEADEGSYDCVVTNSQGSATSTTATLTVNPSGTPEDGGRPYAPTNLVFVP